MPASTPTTTPSGMPSHGESAEFHEHDRHGVAAEPEEHGMAERDQAAVAAQHVPGETHGRPQQHQRHDQLVVGIADQQSEQQIGPGEQGDRHAVRCGAARTHQVRSATRPKIPLGRKKTISRNTTKIAVFCS